WCVAATGLAVLCMVLTGMRYDVYVGLTAGLVFATVLLPVWLPWLRGSRWVVAVTVLAGVAAVSSIWLTVWHSDSRSIAMVGLAESVFLVLGLACGVGAALWARGRMSDALVGG